jgi:bifunctional DNA-binding transcriptional regulator/antitoxin component of YhaV-PrlF toxin-antitoxin module
LVETTFHKDKVYLPKEVKESLGLSEGDRLQVDIVGRDEARIRVVRSSEASKRIIEMLDNPPDLGEIKERLTRREIYEDVP